MSHERVARELRESAELKLRCIESIGDSIARAGSLVVEAFRSGGKLLLCGNGGSASDAQHIAAEFVNKFEKQRRALPALALTTDSSNLTSIGNDLSFDQVFARQVEALGRKGDVLIAISTSGRSPNVLRAIEAAKEAGVTSIALAGRGGGPAAKAADHAVVVPHDVTSRIQEVHITVGHILCGIVDAEMFGA